MALTTQMDSDGNVRAYRAFGVTFTPDDFRKHLTAQFISLYRTKISHPYNQPDDWQFSSNGAYENIIGMVNFPTYMENHKQLGLVELSVVGDEFIWKLTEYGKTIIMLDRI